MELIRLENIYKTYHLDFIDVPVLRGVSLSIQRGELVALMGASGSGKTTLMNILGCLDRPSSGRFWLDGEEMSGLTPDQRAYVRTRKLGFVFQSFNLLPRTSAMNNVLMPLDYSVSRPSERAAYERAWQLLCRVGIGERAGHESTQMSGGQQQRVAIARSLINHPPLLLADEPTGNLDTRTSAEILQMFKELNRDGITIIIVTHNPEVAEHVKRVIHVKDGVIVDGRGGYAGEAGVALPSAVLGGVDGPNAAAAEPNASPSNGSGGKGAAATGTLVQGAAATAVAEAPLEAALVSDAAPALAMPRFRSGWVLPPTLRTAMGALTRNLMRSALTTLGIIIGVAAVIAMIEIGQGSSAAIQSTIASMGANNLMVLPGAASSGGVNFGSGSSMTLTPQDGDEILRQCPAVADVAPVVRARAQIVFGNKNWVPMYIYGTTPSYLAVRDWENMDEGDCFSDRDVRNQNKVCVVGATLVRELFGGESPLNKEVRIQNVAFRVIGVLSPKGANMMGMDQDDIVLAPWTTIKFRVSGQTLANVNQSTSSATSTVNTLSNPYPGSSTVYPAQSASQLADQPLPVRFVTVDMLMVKAASADEIKQSIDQSTELLRERHHISGAQTDDFNIRDMTELTKTMSQTAGLMKVLLVIVAMISLIVGGVGIMNIMLVSVTERTREIGLRMAVGARAGNILRQFLVEAIILCLLGGAVGILIGRLLSMGVRIVLHWPTMVSLPAILLAAFVSALVGVTFGFYPAWKASRLDPIEALRYE